MATLLEQDEMPSSTTIPHGLCRCGCGRKPLRKGSEFLPNHRKRIRLPLSAAIKVWVESRECYLVPLTQGKYAIVSPTQLVRVMRWKWRARKNSRSNTWYAMRTVRVDGKNITVLMHQFILQPDGKKEVDHKSTDGLDNRDENLRFCKDGENQANVGLRSHSTSGYKGVSWHSRIQKWQAYINVNRKRRNLGYFDVKEDAARAYDKAAIELHGEFSRLNFPISRGATSGEHAY